MSKRNICFTVHRSADESDSDFYWDLLPDHAFDEDKDYSDQEYNDLVDQYLRLSPIKYVVYQREVCPETGRHHYQGYVEFNKTCTYKQMRVHLNCPSVHLEDRKGTQEQAIAYCKKEGSRATGCFFDVFEWGVPARQGSRTDLAVVRGSILNSIDSSTNVRDFAIANPVLYVKNHVGIEKLIYHHKLPRNHAMQVEIYWGETGTGKTRKAFEENKDLYIKPFGQWWNGYEGQECVLIDDYDGYLNFREFLQLTDRYPHQVPTKFGFRQFTSKKIIFTSNIDPVLWYSDQENSSLGAFKRRITRVIKFSFSGDDRSVPLLEDDLDFYIRTSVSLESDSDVSSFGDEPRIIVGSDSQVDKVKLDDLVKNLQIKDRVGNLDH